MRNWMDNYRAIAFVVCLCFALQFSLDAQVRGKEERTWFYKFQIREYYIPITLVGASGILSLGSTKYDVNAWMPKTETEADDHFRHVPMWQMYAYDLSPIPHRSHFLNQSVILLLAHLSSQALVRELKTKTRIKRPVGTWRSFPSGHTTTAFVNATILYKEFKDYNLWMAYSGFPFAIATAVLRMTNDAHWLPDVLAGAGLGMLTVNLLYLIKPLTYELYFKRKNTTYKFYPKLTTKSIGVSVHF